jgi:hypothetical protein
MAEDGTSETVGEVKSSQSIKHNVGEKVVEAGNQHLCDKDRALRKMV